MSPAANCVLQCWLEQRRYLLSQATDCGFKLRRTHQETHTKNPDMMASEYTSLPPRGKAGEEGGLKCWASDLPPAIGRLSLRQGLRS
jgi:hypothetical protein